MLKTELLQGWIPAVAKTVPAVVSNVNNGDQDQGRCDKIEEKDNPRYSSASLMASLELARSDPVTMSLEQPTCRALSTMAARSSGCRSLP